MSTSELSWFHCGRCGALFESPLGDQADRRCGRCGAVASLGVLEAAPESMPASALPPNAGQAAKKPGKRSSKKRSGRYFMWILFSGWVGVLGAIVLIARLLLHEAPSTYRPPPSSGISNVDRELLNAAMPECSTTLSRFLVSGTPEARNQYVLNPVATAARMARFDNPAPLANISPATLELTEKAVLKLPGKPAVETLWKTPDGEVIEAVFREENGEWRLDWDHFVRYGDYPWSLFLAGSGPSEGEFRLLARERLSDQRKTADAISLVLYSARFGHPDDPGFQSPEFLVPRATQNGQLLDAAFSLARSGGRVFESKLPALDPQGMIRVRVKVRRTETDLQRSFEITEVTACHWYSDNDPGVTPAPPPALAPGSATHF